MVQFCYSRLYLGTETISCCLCQRMARMDMDCNLKKLGQGFQVSQNVMLCLQKSPKKLLRLVLPDGICLVSSYLYRSSLGMGKSPR